MGDGVAAMRVLRSSFVMVTLVLTSLAAGAGVASAEPAVTVRPSAHLVEGSQVTVKTSGLPAGATARLIECDDFVVEVDVVGNCPDLVTVQADRRGRIATTVAVHDYVIKDFEFGARFLPVYCRADNCRIWVVWTDAAGTVNAVPSAPLEFRGSPATITATPTSGLLDGQRVTVSGTAVGGAGRRVVVAEEACFDIVQAAGCYGSVVLASTTVGPRGGWTVGTVQVHRFLADGTDCADAANILGACQLTARVLTADGGPDDSFGVARLGDPGVMLDFGAAS
jgi:Neocarzinostatin family